MGDRGAVVRDCVVRDCGGRRAGGAGRRMAGHRRHLDAEPLVRCVHPWFAVGVCPVQRSLWASTSVAAEWVRFPRRVWPQGPQHSRWAPEAVNANVYANRR